MYDPLQVVQEFFRVFRLSYARAELWDLLDSAITSKGGDQDHLNLLLHYQCFRTLVEAAWHLHKSGEE